MKNLQLRSQTLADIERQVAKVLNGIGNPEPPLDLASVRELLRLDKQFYTTTLDDGCLRQTVSRLKVAGKQVLLRPTLLREAVRKLSLKALYLPDQKRILLDESLPAIKHRWNEGHEIGHSIIPWHADVMLGDDEATLTQACHEIVEAEANFAAGMLLFLQQKFAAEANDTLVSIAEIRKLSKRYKNTMTSTMWRFIEQSHQDLPMVGLVTVHPHASRRPSDFDPMDPCRYCIQSALFAARFGSVSERTLFSEVVSYCGAQRGGSLGQGEVMLRDDRGDPHLFRFETFFNSYQALTLGVWQRAWPYSSRPLAVNR